MISAAIVLIVVTNYCIIYILGGRSHSAQELMSLIWPIALPSSVAVILIMSALYHTIQDVLDELELRRIEAIRDAQHDPLTGLANKRLLQERVDQAIARFRRADERFAVLLIDLDDFKRVNDLLGHQVGDTVLKEAASRLLNTVREIDTVARFGGDEFLVLQTGATNAADVRHICSRILAELRKPYILGDREMRLPGSVGVAFATDGFDDASDYLRAADVALYAAKANGKNCYRIFSDELDARLQRADKLEKDLGAALETAEGITAHFQPQLGVTGKIVGAETFLRWNHCELGNITPTEAIAIAEDCGLIQPLGEKVARLAAQAARRWPHLSIALNVSPAQFSLDDELPETLHRIVCEEGISPSQIEIEITERLLLDERVDCREQLERLRQYGFRLALDDFGTGYSSLSYLRRFKFDRLKLDRSLVFEADARESFVVIQGVVVMAHSLGLEVVAEGIETDIQEAAALEAGCDALQGYRYGAPMPWCEFENFLDRHNAPKRSSTAA